MTALQSFHSLRNAFTGSTRIARNAGISEANNPTAISTTTTDTRVNGSKADTPRNMLERRRENSSAQQADTEPDAQLHHGIDGAFIYSDTWLWFATIASDRCWSPIGTTIRVPFMIAISIALRPPM